MPEILIGDLPAPVKYYNPEIRDAYKHIERVSGEKLLTMLPEDMREEYRPLLTPGDEYPEEQKIVRAADKLSALIKCIEEERQGNSEFEKAKRATEKAVRDLNLPAADFFVKEYLPSYFLTLDEQDH
jgi:5'-deoxynucleotidase